MPGCIPGEAGRVAARRHRVGTLLDDPAQGRRRLAADAGGREGDRLAQVGRIGRDGDPGDRRSGTRDGHGLADRRRRPGPVMARQGDEHRARRGEGDDRVLGGRGREAGPGGSRERPGPSCRRTARKVGERHRIVRARIGRAGRPAEIRHRREAAGPLVDVEN